MREEFTLVQYYSSNIQELMEGINTNVYVFIFKVSCFQDFSVKYGLSQFTTENTAVIGMTRVQLAQYFVLSNVYSKNFFHFENYP